jgi:beta-glucosidase
MRLRSAAQWLLVLPARSSGLADKNSHQPLEKRTLATSEPFYPSPWMNPDADGWTEAYARAKEFVSRMTLLEKVNLTTGVG